MQITCEYCSKTIVTMLATRSVEAEGEFWDTHVKKKNVQSALDTAFNKGIDSTPVKALLGLPS
jgi:hypothetical protein